MASEHRTALGATISAAQALGPAPASDLGDAVARGRISRDIAGRDGAGVDGAGGDGAASDGAVGPPDAAHGLGWPDAAPDDLALLAEAGLRSVRLTLDWARLEPAADRIDEAAVDQLAAVLSAARTAGLEVWACLHDGPLPGWFAVDEHGFGDAKARRYFWPRFIELAGERFGHLVDGWVPVAEPNRWAARGWLDGARPPFRRDDAEGFAEALEGVLLATVDAALRLRGSGRPVASSHWYVPVAPARLAPDEPPAPEAEAWASRVDEVHRGCWERLLHEGTLVVPNRAPVELPAAREAFDVLGLSYRGGVAVRGDGALLPYPQRTATGPDGTVPWPEGLGLVLHRLAEAFPDRPLQASVGAMGDPVRAADALREVLAIADDATHGGLDLRQLWWRTPIDPSPDAGIGLFDQHRSPTPAGGVASSR